MVLIEIFASIISVVIDAVSLCMVARCIYSLIMHGENGKFGAFLALVTEPFIIPVRVLLAKFNLFENSPIDWSFTISYLLLMVIRILLP
jgi:uncharacterized protein YggT (Ycf19 family)